MFLKIFSFKHVSPIKAQQAAIRTLITLKALSRAAETSHPMHEDFNQILFHTVGVTFLGTPFHGSHGPGYTAAELRIAVAYQNGKSYSRELIEYIRMGTQDKPGPLEEVITRFTELLINDPYRFRIVCFYEQCPTSFFAKLSKLPQSYKQKEIDPNGFGIVCIGQ